MAVAYKGGVCQCCKYNKYIGALEFHHINLDEKNFGISVKGYTRSWENNKKELDKCVFQLSQRNSRRSYIMPIGNYIR